MPVISNPEFFFFWVNFSFDSIHPPPAFGSSPNLEALALEANNAEDMEEEHSVHASAQYSR